MILSMIASWLTMAANSAPGLAFLTPVSPVLAAFPKPSETSASALVYWSAAFILAAYGWTMLGRLLWCVLGKISGTFSIEYYSVFTWLPWRPLAKCLLRIHDWCMQFRYGKKATAGFAGGLERMTLLYKPSMIYLGDLVVLGLRFWMPCGIKGRGASMLLGQARCGKSAHLIARLIAAINAGTNIFSFDCDGTITRVLGRRFKKGAKFCCLDPYGMLRDFLSSACWNVFDEFERAIKREGSLNAAVRWADKISEALIIEDNASQAYFAQASRAFCKALLLYVFVREPDKTLNRFRDLLTRGLYDQAKPGENAHDLLFFEMTETPDFGGIIARGGSLGAQGATKDGRNIVLSTALTQTAWLDDGDMARICSRSDFSVEELQTGRLSLTLVAPTSDMKGRLAPWFRLLLTASLSTAESINGKGNKCLYALDEFCAINRVPILESVPAVFPKYKVSAIFAAQEISQIEATYGKSWETFLSNSDTILWLGTESERTIDYLHKKLGTCTRREKIAAPLFSGQKARYEHRERPVMLHDDLRRFLNPDHGRAIVTRTGARPVQVSNGVYFKQNAIWEHDPDPKHTEPFVKRCFRRLLSLMTAKPAR